MHAALPTPARHAPDVAEALALFERAVFEDERTDAIDKQVIDAVIAHHASLGLPFSSNSMRDDLPG